MAYDNIAAGDAITTNENTILGETASVFEVYGGGTRTSTSNAEMNITNIAGPDGTSTSDAEFQGPENLVAAEDPGDEALATSDFPGFTS